MLLSYFCWRFEIFCLLHPPPLQAQQKVFRTTNVFSIGRKHIRPLKALRDLGTSNFTVKWNSLHIPVLSSYSQTLVQIEGWQVNLTCATCYLHKLNMKFRRNEKLFITLPVGHQTYIHCLDLDCHFLPLCTFIFFSCFNLITSWWKFIKRVILC